MAGLAQVLVSRRHVQERGRWRGIIGWDRCGQSPDDRSRIRFRRQARDLLFDLAPGLVPRGFKWTLVVLIGEMRPQERKRRQG